MSKPCWEEGVWGPCFVVVVVVVVVVGPARKKLQITDARTN